MKRNPLFVIDDLTSTNLEKIPLKAYIQVLSQPQGKIFEMFDFTNFIQGMSFQDALDNGVAREVSSGMKTRYDAATTTLYITDDGSNP